MSWPKASLALSFAASTWAKALQHPHGTAQALAVEQSKAEVLLQDAGKPLALHLTA